MHVKMKENKIEINGVFLSDLVSSHAILEEYARLWKNKRFVCGFAISDSE